MPRAIDAASEPYMRAAAHLDRGSDSTRATHGPYIDTEFHRFHEILSDIFGAVSALCICMRRREAFEAWRGTVRGPTLTDTSESSVAVVVLYSDPRVAWCPGRLEGRPSATFLGRPSLSRPPCSLQRAQGGARSVAAPELRRGTSEAFPIRVFRCARPELGNPVRQALLAVPRLLTADVRLLLCLVFRDRLERERTCPLCRSEVPTSNPIPRALRDGRTTLRPLLL